MSFMRVKLIYVVLSNFIIECSKFVKCVVFVVCD